MFSRRSSTSRCSCVNALRPCRLKNAANDLRANTSSTSILPLRRKPCFTRCMLYFVFIARPQRPRGAPRAALRYSSGHVVYWRRALHPPVWGPPVRPGGRREGRRGPQESASGRCVVRESRLGGQGRSNSEWSMTAVAPSLELAGLSYSPLWDTLDTMCDFSFPVRRYTHDALPTRTHQTALKNASTGWNSLFAYLVSVSCSVMFLC